MAILDEVRTEVDGLRFPEGNRWHDARFWFSDMHDGAVYSWDPVASSLETVVDLDDEQTSGLDWTSDGVMLVSAMRSRQVLRVEADRTAHTHADLSRVTPYLLNDLLLDPRSGVLFVADFGYDLCAGEPFRAGSVFAVRPDGDVALAADDIAFRSSMVFLPGTRTLVLPETFGERLTAFDISDDGAWSDRRVWASLPGRTLDGCCVDSARGVWVATLSAGAFVRVADGVVTDVVAVPGRIAIDCTLGGEDGCTLYLSTADDVMPAVTERTRRGAIESVRVPIAG